MSPPLSRYNPSLIQHTFELNLDGITLQELEKMKKQNEYRLRDIEERFLKRNEELDRGVAIMNEFTKDDQYLIQVRNEVVNVPINSLAELDGDMLNFDTNESEADDQTKSFSKRLIYELRFEKYLKKKIKNEIIRRETFKRDLYVSPEELERRDKKGKIEKMVRTRLEGK